MAWVAQVLMQGMPFVAHIGPTLGLSRDTARNQEITAKKANDPDYQVGQRLRFDWQEQFE